MASSSVKVVLTEDSVRQLIGAAGADRALPRVFLPLENRGPDHLQVAVGFLVYVRSGGFMVVLPSNELVTQRLASLSAECDAEAPAAYAGEVSLETLRGRLQGEGSVQLVDVSWDLVA